MRPDWRIYYDDGSTFDSTEGEALEAPALGVLVIRQPPGDDERGATVVSLWDFYLYHRPSRRWWGVDSFGVVDQLAHRWQDFGGLVVGRMATPGVYQDALNRATADPDFSRAGGRLTRPEASRTR